MPIFGALMTFAMIYIGWYKFMFYHFLDNEQYL